ncbi:hypothetical protein Q5O24_11890 [Eubacteriaceae bacterium ES3]|nr:hypothetical protein Q5O24_11890 [Eubacteriaceae bacterium ES3]
MKNLDVRETLKKAGIRQWEVCEILGIHEAAFSRKMRHELPEDEKQKIYEAIEVLKNQKEAV